MTPADWPTNLQSNITYTIKPITLETAELKKYKIDVRWQLACEDVCLEAEESQFMEYVTSRAEKTVTENTTSLFDSDLILKSCE
jgi:hypothetical protein